MSLSVDNHDRAHFLLVSEYGHSQAESIWQLPIKANVCVRSPGLLERKVSATLLAVLEKNMEWSIDLLKDRFCLFTLSKC